MKTIKISKVPGVAQEFAVEAGANVGALKDMYAAATSEPITGYEARVNNVVVADSFVPTDNAKVYLLQQVKGN